MKKIIKLGITIVAMFGFYTASNCYYAVSATRPLKVFIENDTLYPLDIKYDHEGDNFDTKKWVYGETRIGTNSDEELIFWKKPLSMQSTETQKFTFTGTTDFTGKPSFSIKMEFKGSTKGNTLYIYFPSRAAYYEPQDFRIDKVPEYVVGTIKNRPLKLSLVRSRSYGSGVNQYGVIVFKLHF